MSLCASRLRIAMSWPDLCHQSLSAQRGQCNQTILHTAGLSLLGGVKSALLAGGLSFAILLLASLRFLLYPSLVNTNTISLSAGLLEIAISWPDLCHQSLSAQRGQYNQTIPPIVYWYRGVLSEKSDLLEGILASPIPALSELEDSGSDSGSNLVFFLCSPFLYSPMVHDSSRGWLF